MISIPSDAYAVANDNAETNWDEVIASTVLLGELNGEPMRVGGYRTAAERNAGYCICRKNSVGPITVDFLAVYELTKARSLNPSLSPGGAEGGAVPAARALLRHGPLPGLPSAATAGHRREAGRRVPGAAGCYAGARTPGALRAFTAISPKIVTGSSWRSNYSKFAPSISGLHFTASRCQVLW